MTSIRMCGVGLWSAPDEGRAVIWCEDHGKLAFYAPSTRQDGMAQDESGLPCSERASEEPSTNTHEGWSLDAGDLIEFDMEDGIRQRRAHNPRLLVCDHAPFIATDLRDHAHVQSEPARPHASLSERTDVVVPPSWSVAQREAVVVPFMDAPRSRALDVAS